MEKKRGVLVAASLTALLAGTAKAHIYYNESEHRTHWSMVKHSLISGDWKWSIYAHDLIPRNVHYSPYAFLPSHSTGLVWENRGGYFISSLNQQEVFYKPSANSQNNSNSSIAFLVYNFQIAQPEAKRIGELKEENKAKHEYRKASIEHRKLKIAKKNETIINDPVNEIYNHFNKNNLSFKNHNPLILDGEVASTTFFLDKKRIILYFNTDKIEKQNGFVREKVCKDYLETSSELAKKYVEIGWNIYFVTFKEGKMGGLEALAMQ